METFYRQYLARSHGSGEPVSLTPSHWSGSSTKRAFDFVSAALAVCLLLPLMLAAAIAIKLSSPGPVLFRQRRMGRGGSEFTIYKFRTMRVDIPGPGVTRKGDRRLTALGAFLRRLKLDELPQLFNVLKGDMSLVGPRPKLPRHQIYLLMYRPGVTGAASLAFRNEEAILHGVPHASLDDYQIHVLMPLKKHLDQTYMAHSTMWSDLRVLGATVLGRGSRLNEKQLRRFQHSLLSLDVTLRVRFSNGERDDSDSTSLTADVVF